MSKIKTIYGLLDPRNEETFYVGESVQVDIRYYQHLSMAWGNLADPVRGHQNKEKDLRIREIMYSGNLPVVLILDWSDRSTESDWIQKMRDNGEPLTNRNTGVLKHKPETIEKMKKSQLTIRDQMSERSKKQWADPVWREMMLRRIKEGKARKKEGHDV